MMLGKLVRKNGEYFVRDLTTEDLHHVPDASGLTLFGYYSFEVNEDDDATDLKPAADALRDYGVNPEFGSFYCTEECDEAEAFFGTCELTGMKGSIVPCRYRSADGSEVVTLRVGEWLVGSVLGSLAGAF